MDHRMMVPLRLGVFRFCIIFGILRFHSITSLISRGGRVVGDRSIVFDNIVEGRGYDHGGIHGTCRPGEGEENHHDETEPYIAHQEQIILKYGIGIVDPRFRPHLGCR